MNRYFVVCDEEQDYVSRFTELVNERQWVPYQIQGMTGTDGLGDFCSGHKVETLLIEEELYQDEMSKLPVGNIWLLTGQESDAESGQESAQNGKPGFDDLTARNYRQSAVGLSDQDYGQGSVQKGTKAFGAGWYQSHKTAGDHGKVRRVFKYQPVESIIAAVLVRETSVLPPSSDMASVQMPTKMIGIYSPVRRCQKTAFALALGQILAKEQKVLYLNFESLTGLHLLLSGEREHDLADVFYLTSNGKVHFSDWGEKWVRQVGGLDYVLPVLSPLDIMSTEEADFITVLEMLEREGGYGTIILEFDESCKAFLQLLIRCSVIYMPTGSDQLSASQLSQYEYFLKENGQSDVLDRTIRIKPPYYNGFGGKEQYVEQLVWGELGDYVRSLL